MAKTKIEWADRVWNPVTGCTKVSEGCRHCYAERMAKRLAGRAGYPAAPDQFKVTLHPEKLGEPLRWKKPARIFVSSMGDLFHDKVPNSFLNKVFGVMALTKWHTFLLLTKRADNMSSYINLEQTPIEVEKEMESFAGLLGWCSPELEWPLPNVWLGVSAESHMEADWRIKWLLKTLAAVRFVSVEPMLEEISLFGYLAKLKSYPNSRGLDWVICGAESGPGARPMELDWARSLRDQCQAAGVQFFLKQVEINGKLVKMPAIDGKIWDEIPGISI